MKREAHSSLVLYAKSRNHRETIANLSLKLNMNCTVCLWVIVPESLIHERMNTLLRYTCKLQQRWMIYLKLNYSQGYELVTCSFISIYSVKRVSNIFFTVMNSSLMCMFSCRIRSSRWLCNLWIPEIWLWTCCEQMVKHEHVCRKSTNTIVWKYPL